MSSKQDDVPPSPMAILVMYIMFGSAISFLAGREPVSLPDDLLQELGPALIAVCAFLLSYSSIDVLYVGHAKAQCGFVDTSYNELPKQLPEPVYLAMRTQTNQLEQMPVFVVGTIGCALFVNGIVAGIMGSLWVLLRWLYASAYRNAVGITLKKAGLFKFTVPCYFLVNPMVAATMVHFIRAYVTK